jgi:TPR repeat protein
MSPGEAAATRVVRARRYVNGSVAREESVEPRWRDIQWIDFMSGADNNPSPASETVARLAEPVPTPAMSWPVEPGQPVARGDDISFPRWFDFTCETDLGAIAAAEPAPPMPDPVEPAPPATWDVTIPSSSVPLPPPEIARFAPALTNGVGVLPRVPASALAPQEPPPASEPRPRRSFSAPPKYAAERPFPASISTPVSTPPSPPAPGAWEPWQRALAAWITGTGAVLRDASGTVTAAAAGGFIRARTALRPRQPAEPGIDIAECVSSRSETHARLTGAIDDGVSRFFSSQKHRLRVLGLIALGVALVGLAAYRGGALLVRLAGPRADTATASANSTEPTANSLTKQLALADKATKTPQAATPAPAPSSADDPPSDPVARAAFYMTRAKAGDATAQYDVGVLYARGDGLVQDYASAATWFHAAAAQGNVAAEYNLGVMYQRGLGVTPDETAALNWYRSAADQNHPSAQFNLALDYADGNGTKQDFATAARWYRRAADQGLMPAMVNLAILYEEGNGVDRSLIDAYAWYVIAGECGDNAAKQRAGDLFQQFNDKDKARAEGLAATIGAALDSVARRS